MRKLLSISLLVLVTALVVVSCSLGNETPDDSLALISFSTEGGETRSLTTTNPQLDKSKFYWFYTATKTDGTGLEYGAASEQLPVKKNQKGLGSVGAFSYGDWDFTLYAYTDVESGGAKGKNEVYSGTTSATVNKTSQTITILVASKQTTGIEGTLLFPLKSAMIAKTVESKTVDTSKFLEVITIEPVDGREDFTFGNEKVGGKTKTLYDYNTVDSSDTAKRTCSLESGSYKVTFKYIQDATLTTTGNPGVTAGYTDGYAVASESVYIAIADHLTTEIGGEETSNKGKVTLDVKSGVTPVEVKDVAVVKDTATTFDGIKKDSDNNDTGVKTVVPANALTAGGTSTIRNEVYSPEVASQAGADYIFSSGSGAAVGGISSSLFDNESTSEQKTFGKDEDNKAKKTTQTFFLAIGLNNGLYYKKASVTDVTFPEGDPTTSSYWSTYCDISSAYTGNDKSSYTGTQDGTVYSIPNGEIVYYNPTTGMTIFQVEHFSTYYFADKYAVCYNAKNNTAYKTLEDAIKNAPTGSTITMLKDYSITTDFIGLSGKSITLDLNGKTITADTVTENLKDAAFGLFCLKSNSNLTVKNGSITTERKTQGDYNYQTLKIDPNSDNVSLTVNNVTITAPNGVIISAGVSNLNVTVKDSKIYYSTWGYGIGSIAENPSEKGNINVVINKTLIEPRADITNTKSF